MTNNVQDAMADLQIDNAAATSQPPVKAQPNKSKGKDKKGAAPGLSQYPLELDPPPEYIAYRIRMFDELKKKADEELKAKPREDIKVTLPDGAVVNAISWETSPMDIAKSLSKSLPDKLVIAKVDGELWDLGRPLEKDCTLELLTFDHDQGKEVFWHSSAHVLGEACERHYGCHLCLGPPIEEGFYYEMDIAHRNVEAADYSPLETIAKSAIKEKQPFERLVMSKEDLLKMFGSNRFKVRFINDKIPDGTSSTVYRCGPLIDLCKGPHIPHTGRIKAFAVTKNSSSYFLGKAENDTLQRIYGISFPDNKLMKEYQELIEEAAKRDHRKIGKEQELFFFHEMSPGSCFFLPHGARLYNTLMEFMKSEYRKRGYTEVISPNMFNSKLWETSGHWANYRDDMFTFDVEKEVFGLKPMNCPGHCLMFKHRERSYKELPLRYADFGVLHRNESHGSLTGLTRVRRFCQDDAHIFCREDQVEEEISSSLDFLTHAYGVFGFPFSLKLSTRPEKFEGDVAVWDMAEKRLEAALDKFAANGGGKWELNPGDGAFYGPKIDILITDALRRKHQCATIQLDFVQPMKFNLEYRTAAGDEKDEQFARPVMVHRAVLGSVERMIAILTEHYGGKWPMWLSPRQVCVIPVAGPFFKYASEVRQTLHDAGLFADADLGDNTLNKKIRTAEIAHYNFILVVGEEEETTRSVNVRNRDDVGKKGKADTVALNVVVEKLAALRQSRSLHNQLA